MKADLANLRLEDEEEGDSIPCVSDAIEEENNRQYCLVGKALTDCVPLPFSETNFSRPAASNKWGGFY